MSKVFVVTNQHGHFINKHKEWVDGRDSKLLFRSTHKDEALNLVFELSSKDIYLRAEAISVDLDDKKQPIVEVTADPIPGIIPDTSPDTTSEPEGEEPAQNSDTSTEQSELQSDPIVKEPQPLTNP